MSTKAKTPRTTEKTTVQLGRKVKMKQTHIVNILGLADSDDFSIELEKCQSSKELCSTALHELCHCYFPDLSEEAVEEISNHMRDVLWKLGFRRIMK